MTQHPFLTWEFLNQMVIAAAGDGARNMVGLLLRQGADPNYGNGAALIAAAEAGHARVVDFLVHCGARVESQNHRALSNAATNGHAMAVKILLEAGADVSIHEHGPYRDAMARGDYEVAGLLRMAGSYDPREPRSLEEDRREIVNAASRREHFRAACTPRP